MDKYNVSGTNGTCLLANMGLQLNITYKQKDDKVGLRALRARVWSHVCSCESVSLGRAVTGKCALNRVQCELCLAAIRGDQCMSPAERSAVCQEVARALQTWDL